MTNRAVLWLGLAAIAAWSVMGFWPYLYYGSFEKAAVLGDAFNSFFSSIGFVVAMCALIQQMDETKAAGIREVEQSKLQAEQMEITRKTAEQQEAMVRDAQRNQAMNALIKVENDTVSFLRAMIALYEGTVTNVDNSVRATLVSEYESSRDELQGNRLRLRILFGEVSDSLNSWIDHSSPRQ